MAAPTPIHRDPDADGDDYGCVGRSARRANAAVAALVARAQRELAAGTFDDPDALIDFVHSGLTGLAARYDCGSCDTIVKENVFAALHEAARSAGLEPIHPSSIYGW